ncbi:hypothetical protein [Bacteroides sp.]|uniref:hypothetical protein n=1 Tax=Bacteroides sp. TaxID=29523 RepID=UPI0025BA7EA9|nr:hypothetical protein [Bacteroides sp.]
MRKLNLLMGISCWLCAPCLLLAQDLKLKTADLDVSIAENGYYRSICVKDRQVLDEKVSTPLVTACVEGKLVHPTELRRKGKRLVLTMADKRNLTLTYKETPLCITLEATEVPDEYDAILFGPVHVNIHDVVGDVVGVVQGDGVALGMQALNIKTIGGIPAEYVEPVRTHYEGKTGRSAQLSVGSVPDYRLAAVDFGNGASFQLSARNRTRQEYRMVQNQEGSWTLPVQGPDARIEGAKIAMFGCSASDALERIGAIEVEQGLPHPMFADGWGKSSRQAMRSYLITRFSENNLDFVLDKAEKAGLKYVYHPGPFRDWGHFNWSKGFTVNGDDGVKAMVDKAAERGIALGVHTLTNFMTTNDAYVTPVPSEHLLKQGILKLVSDIDAEQTTLTIEKSHLFKTPLKLNALMIDKELITFGKMEEKEERMLLTGCRRGAYGTSKSAHTCQTPLYKLWDYPYNTLFPDLELQDVFTDRLVEIFNKTGLKQISFDGLEGCMYTGQDDYATTRFVERFVRGVNHNVLNDASRLNHFTWHMHTRMNWGEPWGEAMRTGQVEQRIKNQNYFERNLFPRMLGWFLIRLADRKFECSTLEDLEWALSESAGFDAGYAMNIEPRTLQKHGQIDMLLEAIKNWDMLREKKCFTPEQMTRLKDPATEWHLEKKGNRSFLLYPLSVTKHYNCSLGELQPGQPGGADWSVHTPYGGKFAFRLKVEWEGYIENPSFMTEKGTILFPCKVEPGQYLLYNADGTACVTDRNFNLLRNVVPEGVAELPVGDSHVAFSCQKGGDTDPDVSVRFITRGQPESITVVD